MRTNTTQFNTATRRHPHEQCDAADLVLIAVLAVLPVERTRQLVVGGADPVERRVPGRGPGGGVGGGVGTGRGDVRRHRTLPPVDQRALLGQPGAQHGVAVHRDARNAHRLRELEASGVVRREQAGVPRETM